MGHTRMHGANRELIEDNRLVFEAANRKLRFFANALLLLEKNAWVFEVSPSTRLDKRFFKCPARRQVLNCNHFDFFRPILFDFAGVEHASQEALLIVLALVK